MFGIINTKTCFFFFEVVNQNCLRHFLWDGGSTAGLRNFQFRLIFKPGIYIHVLYTRFLSTNMNYESLSGMLASLYLYVLTLILSQAAVLSAALQLCNLF